MSEQERGYGRVEDALRPLIGRDWEQSEADNIYRGPVKSFSINTYTDDEGQQYRRLEVYVDWLAMRGASGWHLVREPVVEEQVEQGILMTETGLGYFHPHDLNGETHISLHMIGSVVVHAPGDSLAREDLLRG